MAKEVTRSLKQKIVVELWARAAGRCEFNNCNRPLYKSPVTQEQGNISEIAHIWSFSEKGARGWGIFKSARNKIGTAFLLSFRIVKIPAVSIFRFRGDDSVAQ